MGKTNWNVDFNSITSDFGIVPDGEYHVRLESHKTSVSQAGNEVLNFQFDILDETKENGDGDPVKVRGRKLFDSIAVTPKSAFRYKNLLLAAGYSNDDIAKDTPEPEELYGTEMVAIVGHEAIMRQGELTDDMRNKIIRLARLS